MVLGGMPMYNACICGGMIASDGSDNNDCTCDPDSDYDWVRESEDYINEEHGAMNSLCDDITEWFPDDDDFDEEEDDDFCPHDSDDREWDAYLDEGWKRDEDIAAATAYINDHIENLQRDHEAEKRELLNLCYQALLLDMLNNETRRAEVKRIKNVLEKFDVKDKVSESDEVSPW